MRKCQPHSIAFGGCFTPPPQVSKNKEVGEKSGWKKWVKASESGWTWMKISPVLHASLIIFIRRLKKAVVQFHLSIDPLMSMVGVSSPLPDPQAPFYGQVGLSLKGFPLPWGQAPHDFITLCPVPITASFFSRNGACSVHPATRTVNSQMMEKVAAETSPFCSGAKRLLTLPPMSSFLSPQNSLPG